MQSLLKLIGRHGDGPRTVLDSEDRGLISLTLLMFGRCFELNNVNDFGINGSVDCVKTLSSWTEP